MDATCAHEELEKGEVTDWGPRTPFVAALNAIYTEDAETFAALLTTHPALLRDQDGAWPLVLHLADNDWEAGIELYQAAGGSMDVASTDFLTRLPGACGGLVVGLLNGCHGGLGSGGPGCLASPSLPQMRSTGLGFIHRVVVPEVL
jgi:hypothetical protein